VHDGGGLDRAGRREFHDRLLAFINRELAAGSEVDLDTRSGSAGIDGGTNRAAADTATRSPSAS
jgi:hypothetical protein